MKLNEEQCHHIIFGANKERVNMHVGEAQIEESEYKNIKIYWV